MSLSRNHCTFGRHALGGRAVWVAPAAAIGRSDLDLVARLNHHAAGESQLFQRYAVDRMPHGMEPKPATIEALVAFGRHWQRIEHPLYI